MNTLQISTSLQISKPDHVVFEAIINPAKMMNYFISESSGKIDQGETLQWKFPEFDGWMEINVLKVMPYDFISFEWQGAPETKTHVGINLTKLPDNNTLVNVCEGILPLDDKGLKWYGQNTEGWANFLACMKAYLEYGINLRKGAFDFMKLASTK